ncbi:hypothetical protein EBB59_07515 [Lysobacter pythonis]|uniref:Uncharacterized protein n=1 Tax=Solilutibacter pythonis TaxID=2483112 RepID=A0A3M2I087_9GAMM|nr:hypothetical protein [Lysobacter pythonis]RMH93049.1 hypothetical protein EBB59_07515 [Lysobacter pythonis]
MSRNARKRRQPAATPAAAKPAPVARRAVAPLTFYWPANGRTEAVSAAAIARIERLPRRLSAVAK